MAAKVPNKRNPSDALQNTLFTRYVRQKLHQTRGIEVTDLTKDMQDGLVLINLMEVLSEKPCTKKYNKTPKMKPHQIDNCNVALQYVWDCGVQMQLKPSAEQINAGDVKSILSLIYAIMLKYMKVGDEDEAMNARDALLMWSQQQVSGHDIKVEDMTKSWDDGLALCAIINKMRPTLLPWDQVKKDDPVHNFELAQNAAQKYFGLEKYLTAKDFYTLDEKCMVVYISEYFYGIAEQRKLDLAAKAIGKVIKFTKENDAMKKDYEERVAALKTTLDKVKLQLNDRTVDNNMEGAKRRLDDFYAYKLKEKNELIGLQLSLEGTYNQLAMRLAQNKRPIYEPKGMTLKDIENEMNQLEKTEQERKIALHAELNRQIKLQKLNEQHTKRMDKLKTWMNAKKEYLNLREVVNSVSEAELQISLLDAYDIEAASVKENDGVQLNKLTEELANEKYYKIDEVRKEDADISALFEELASLSKIKRPILIDHNQREIFKEKVMLNVQQHVNKHAQLKSWIATIDAYLKKKESVTSVAIARTELSKLDASDKDYEAATQSLVPPLKKLGAEVKNAVYESQYSKYAYEHPEEIVNREAEIDKLWDELKTLSAEKREVLSDDLAREDFREKVLQNVKQHADKHAQIVSWCNDKIEYLKKKETVTSVAEARTQISLLDTFDVDQAASADSQVVQIKKLGDAIRTAKYSTKHSTYLYEKPQDIVSMEAEIDKLFTDMTSLSKEKHAVLSDDLTRELFKDKVLQDVSIHQNKHAQLMIWIQTQEAYLKRGEEIDCVSKANTQLVLLDACENDKKLNAEASVAPLKQLGDTIRAAKYSTKYSTYLYEKPQDVNALEAEIDSKWQELSTLSAAKKKTLEEQLAQEKEKERLRLLFASEGAAFMRFANDCKENCAAAHFGMELADVEAYKTTLDKSNADINSTLTTKLTACKDATAKLVALNVTENQYAKFTLQDLETTGQNTVTQALSDRQAAYDKEVARLRHNDKLCREFAAKVDPFAKWIADQRDVISHAQGDLDDQLKQVKDKQASAEKDSAPLSEIKELEAGLEAAGINNNPHTTLNAKDIAVLFQQYQAFLTRKERMINEEIEHVRLRGITPEQLEEIKKIFATFDKDKSGAIDKKELKACMYALGEEKTKADIENYMKQYGKEKGITADGFTEIMIPILGVTAGKDDIVQAFKNINRNADLAKADLTECVMTKDDYTYFTTSAPKSGSDYDYKAWTETIFSR